MIKVGVDAQMLCRTLTGIERYAMEILKELIKRPDLHIYLYAPRPLKVDMSNFENVTVRTANMNYRGSGTVCNQLHLPYWSKQDRVDVMWGPAHRLPRLLPSNIARVVTIHDLVWKHAAETMRPMSLRAEKILTPDAIRLADIVVADSQSTAIGIAAEFPSVRDRVRVVHLGATALPEAEGKEALERYEIRQPYFLFVGTLEPRKNLRRMLEAYAQIDSDTREKCNLVIAGGTGWGNENLVSIIRDLGLLNTVKLTGYVSDQELATLYCHALFLAMPSLYEGFGLPLVEAMSFGVPVLTSSVSSLPEVAGDAGILVDPESVESISTGLMKMIGDPGLRGRLAVHAAENVKRFDWGNAANELSRIFYEAIAMRREHQASA